MSICLVGFVWPDQQFSHVSGGSCAFSLLPLDYIVPALAGIFLGDGWWAHTVAWVYGAVLTALPLFGTWNLDVKIAKTIQYTPFPVECILQKVLKLNLKLSFFVLDALLLLRLGARAALAGHWRVGGWMIVHVLDNDRHFRLGQQPQFCHTKYTTQNVSWWNPSNCCYYYYTRLGSVVVGRRTCDREVAGSTPAAALFGQQPWASCSHLMCLCSVHQAV